MEMLFHVVSKKILCISCGIQRKCDLMWFPTKILFHAVSKENTLLCGIQRKYYVFHVTSKDNIVLFLFAENIIFRGFQKLYFMWLEKKILLDWLFPYYLCGFQSKYDFIWFPKKITFNVVSKEIIFNVVSKENNI